MSVSWLSGWAYRKEITIDETKVSDSLIHFPIPIYISSSSGQTSQDLTDIFIEVGENWQNIAVTKDDGVTQLYVEVDTWSSSTGKALLWVSKVDLIISDTDPTKLFIYFDSSKDNITHVGTAGEKPEVWDTYTGIRLGLSQEPTGGTDCILDSTSNNNNGTPFGSMTSNDIVDGYIGKAIDFDGVNDYIRVLHNVSWKPTDNLSLKLVIRKNGNTEAYPYPVFMSVQADTYESYSNAALIGMWHYRDRWVQLRLQGGGFSGSWGDPYALDHQWLVFYVSSTRGGVVNYYLNGVKFKQDSRADSAAYWGDTNQELYLGTGEYNRDGRCTIEELRIESTNRSEAWQTVDYYAQTDSLLIFSNTEEVAYKTNIGSIMLLPETSNNLISIDIDSNTTMDNGFLYITMKNHFVVVNMESKSIVDMYSLDSKGKSGDALDKSEILNSDISK
jgi:hypothetical protein